MSRRRGLVRAGLRFLFRRAIAIYFREIEVIGDVPSAATEGRVFCANHVNGLVDPTLVLSTAPCEISPVGKSTLWRIPGLRWLLDAVNAVPIVRRRDMPGKTAAQNDEVFDKVADHLTLGGNILIFPEGTSHNEPHLLGLRTGAGRMLARARQRAPAAHLTYQAVALEFEDRTTFRSRALVVYGPVRTVEAAAEEPEAVALRITEQVKLDLSELLVEATTWDERVAIVRVAEMFVNAEGSDSLARWNEIGRRVEAARRALSDPAYQAIARAVNAYHARLGAAGLSDLQLARSGPALGPWRVARAVALVSTLPLALVGAVLFAVPYQLPRLAVRFSGGTPDVHSTYKLATGILAYPIFAGIYIFGAATVLNAPLALVAALVVLVSPLLALAWLDRSAHLGGALRALLRPAQASELRAERARLLAMLEETQTRLSG